MQLRYKCINGYIIFLENVLYRFAGKSLLGILRLS